MAGNASSRQDEQDEARKTQSRNWGELASALDSPYDLHKGGSGDREFMSRVDPKTGFWLPGKGAIRWLFHIVPQEDGFRVELPRVRDAADLPGAVSTSLSGAVRHKFVLSYTVNTLFRQPDGTYAWPKGWQWTLFLVLSSRIRENSNSLKIHRLNLVTSTVMSNGDQYSVKRWALVGNLDPKLTYQIPKTKPVYRYGSIGNAVAEYLSRLTTP